MKAITIWQPWATLIMAGAKPYEFRGWPAPRALRGQRIAIHAGSRAVKVAEIRDLLIRLRSAMSWSTALVPEIATPLLERWSLSPTALPLGAILGTAVLGQPVRSSEIVHQFGGPVADSDRIEHCNWAWPLSEIEVLEPYVPMRGAQGFWDCSLDGAGGALASGIGQVEEDGP